MNVAPVVGQWNEAPDPARKVRRQTRKVNFLRLAAVITQVVARFAGIQRLPRFVFQHTVILASSTTQREENRPTRSPQSDKFLQACNSLPLEHLNQEVDPTPARCGNPQSAMFDLDAQTRNARSALTDLCE